MQDWTAEEKQMHEEGKRLLMKARSRRKARIQAEMDRIKREKERAANAQRLADEQFLRKQDLNVNAFMSEFAGLLSKYNLYFMPIDVVSAGQDMPVFKLAARDVYKAPDYIVNVRPGVGFNWKR